jgi:hypothetical protein
MIKQCDPRAKPQRLNESPTRMTSPSPICLFLLLRSPECEGGKLWLNEWNYTNTYTGSALTVKSFKVLNCYNTTVYFAIHSWYILIPQSVYIYNIHMLLTIIKYRCETNERLKMELQTCLLFSKSLRDRNSASGSPRRAKLRLSWFDMADLNMCINQLSTRNRL